MASCNDRSCTFINNSMKELMRKVFNAEDDGHVPIEYKGSYIKYKELETKEDLVTRKSKIIDTLNLLEDACLREYSENIENPRIVLRCGSLFGQVQSLRQYVLFAAA